MNIHLMVEFLLALVISLVLKLSVSYITGAALVYMFNGFDFAAPFDNHLGYCFIGYVIWEAIIRIGNTYQMDLILLKQQGDDNGKH